VSKDHVPEALILGSWKFLVGYWKFNGFILNLPPIRVSAKNL